MSLVDDAASRLADEWGVSVDKVRPGLEGLDEAQLEEIANASRTERVLGGGFRVLADQPSRAANAVSDNVLSAGSKLALGGGAVAGGTFLGDQYLQTRREEFQAKAKDDMSAAVQEIINDPHLNSQEKEDLISELRQSDFLDTPASDSENGGLLGGLFGGGLFGGMGPMEWFVLLIVIYFAGRTASNYALSQGGN